MIESPLLLVALIAAATALAFWLDRNVPALSKLGASLLAIILGAILSNTGLVVPTSPVYDVIGGPVTSLAIAWLLLSVNLSDVRDAGGRMVGAFALAVLGTALGAAVGAFIFAGALGEDTWRLAGTLTGTYSGGGLNFVAVGRGLGLSESLFVGTTAADNVTTALWMAFTLTIPLWLGRFYPRPEMVRGPSEEEPGEHHPFFALKPLSTLRLAHIIALGLVLVVVSEWIGSVVPQVPTVLWLTTLALIVGHVPALRPAEGSMQMGNLALHAFFVVLGVFSRISEIFAVGLEVFYYTLVVVAVHGLVLFGVGRLLRLDIGSLSVASQASVGGPSTALAQAVAHEWRGLVLPGIIVGLLGYAIGNYVGFGVAYLIRGLGVGL